MLIGIATLKTEPWELEDNFQRMEGYVREAARRRARVVVAPESVLDGYVFNEDPESTPEGMRKIAQTVPNGPYIARARELSCELGIYLIFGFLECEGEDLFNSCLMLDPQGEVLTRYRKLTTAGEYAITPGRELKPFDTPIGRIGFLLCSDRNADNCAVLGVQGSEIIFIPMDGSGGPENTEKMRWRARENGCWIVIANTWSAIIIGPSGEIHLERYETECASVQRLVLAESKANPRRLAARRPDLYGPLLESSGEGRLYDEEGRLTATGEQRRQESRRNALERKRRNT